MTLPLTHAEPFTESLAAGLFPDLDLPDRWWKVTVTVPADQGRGRMLPGLPPAETAEPGEEWRVTIPVQAQDEAAAVGNVRAAFAGRQVMEMTVAPLAL